jgi:transforming growth factor-beta-induced protein
MKFLIPTVTRSWVLALSLLMTTALVSSCNDDDDTGPIVDNTTIAQRLQADNDLSTLATILSQPAYQDLRTAASDPNATLTLFAPTNAAFAALVSSLGLSSATDLPEAIVREVLEYHIITRTLPSASLSAGQVATLQGESLTVTTSGGVQVNGIAVTQADITASNGVIHKIGGVLLPAEPTAIAGSVLAPAYFNNNFSILVQAIRQAGLVDALLGDGPFTVFAPTNDAFAAAGITSLDGLTAEDLEPILLYHVVEGEVLADDLAAGGVTTLGGSDFWVSLNDNGAFINGNTQVITTDVAASNGVVHVINRTLLPPSQNIVEIVQSLAGAAEGAEFTQLLAAVLRVTQGGGADLVTALSGGNGGDGFTVLAPTDAAFQAVYDADNGIGSIDDIPVATLQAILLTHVINGRVFSADLADGNVAPLQAGQTLIIDASTPAVSVQNSNSANINAGASDVLATNGVIHVLDAVLLPAN